MNGSNGRRQRIPPPVIHISNSHSTVRSTLAKQPDDRLRYSHSSPAVTRFIDPTLPNSSIRSATQLLLMNETESTSPYAAAAAAAAAATTTTTNLNNDVGEEEEEEEEEEATRHDQFGSQVPTSNNDNVPFLQTCQSLTNQQQQPNQIVGDISCPYMIDYHYGMELAPSNFVNPPIPPCHETNRNVVSLPMAATTDGDSSGRSVGTMGMMMDSNPAVPLSAHIPMLSASPWKTALSSSYMRRLQQYPNINNLSSSQPQNSNLHPVGTDENDKNKSVNLNNDSSLPMASRPPPPLQMTFDSHSLTRLPINCSNVNDELLPCQPPDIQSNLLSVTTNRYNCHLCKFSCLTINELNMHLLIHNSNRSSAGLILNSASEIPPLAPTSSLQTNTTHEQDFANLKNKCRDCGHPLRSTGMDGDNNCWNGNEMVPYDKDLVYFCDNCGKEYQMLSGREGASVPPLTNYHHTRNQLKLGPYPQQQTYLSISDNNNYQNERFYCSRCDKSYKHNRDLRKHEKVVHGLDNFQLNKPTRNNREQREGIAINKITNQDQQNSSVQLDYNYNNTKDIDNTASTQNNNNQPESAISKSRRFRCDTCWKCFRGPFELRRHITTVHEHKKSFRCNICGKYFRDTYEIKRHNFSQHRRYFANMCLGENVTSFDNTATDEISKLALRYNSGGSGRGEFDISHNGGSVELSSNQPLSTNNIDTGVMESNDNNTIGDNLTGEKNSVHSLQRIKTTNNYTFGSLQHHNPENDQFLLTNIDNEYYCGICTRNFRGVNEFRRHYSTVHEKKYRYKCIHCGKLWRDQYDLKRHCRRGHHYGKDIDKAFIRRCLLANNQSNIDPTDLHLNDSLTDTKITNLSDIAAPSNSMNDNTNYSHDGGCVELSLFNSNNRKYNNDDGGGFTGDNQHHFFSQAPTFSVNDHNRSSVSKENSNNMRPITFADTLADKQGGFVLFDNDLRSSAMMDDRIVMVPTVDQQPPINYSIESDNNNDKISSAFSNFNNHHNHN